MFYSLKGVVIPHLLSITLCTIFLLYDGQATSDKKYVVYIHKKILIATTYFIECLLLLKSVFYLKQPLTTNCFLTQTSQP